MTHRSRRRIALLAAALCVAAVLVAASDPPLTTEPPVGGDTKTIELGINWPKPSIERINIGSIFQASQR